jgi:predicted histone-like DNA-binding protein
VGLQETAKETGGRTALSLRDGQSLLSNLMELMPWFLKRGQPVKPEGLGTFRITVSSSGATPTDELNARHVKGVKLAFPPEVELKRTLEDISFEIIQ